MSEEEIAEFLDTQVYVVIGTQNSGGWPHLVTMGFAMVDGDLMFQGYPKSQKFANLRRDNRITCLIEDPGAGYHHIRGVQIFGYAEIVEDLDVVTEVAHRIATKLAPILGVPFEESTPKPIEEFVPVRAAVRVKASKIVTWDHRKLNGEY